MLRVVCLAAFVLFGSGEALAAARFSVGGNWSVTSTWSTACGGAGGSSVPANNDNVTICANTTVTLNTNTASLGSVTTQANGILTDDGTAGRTLNIGGGGGDDITNGGTINFSSGTTIVAGANISWGGAGTWTLGAINANTRTLTFSNAMTINLSAATPIVASGTISNGTIVTFNFNGTVAQALPNSATILYGAITINNTAGVTLGNALTTLNLRDNLTVQTGTLQSGGFAITGTAAKTFQVANGATFRMSGAGAFPTGFSTFTFGATSTVKYNQSNAQNISAQTYGNLEVNPSANTITHTFAAGTTTVQGNLTVGGTNTGVVATAATNNTTLTVNGGVTISANSTLTAHATNTLTVKGAWSNSGTFTSSGGTVLMNGATAQSIGGSSSTSFTNLTVTNSAGVTLSINTTVAGAAAGALTLTNSVISTGANTLITSGNCNTANLITRNTTGHINGNLQLKFPTGAQTCTFHVGDGAVANYTPVAITFTNVSVAGSLIGTATALDYSDANIPVNPLANVTRYWTLTLPGSGPLTFTGSYSNTFTYLAGDNDNAAFAANYVIAKGSTCAPICTWTLPSVSGTPTSTSSTATGMTSFSVHVVGRRVSESTSTVLASPAVVPADGISTSTITVTLRDPAGNVISGRTVTLSAGGGSSTITTVSGTSDVNGQATFTVKDSTVESVTYTATSEGVAITQTVKVEFAPTSFNAFETSTAANSITGQLYTKKISTGFTIDVVAIKGGAQVGTFGGLLQQVQVDLVTGSTGGANCPGGTVTSISAGQNVTLTSGRGTTAALTPSTATAYRDVRVRILYPAASPAVTTCSLDNFAIRPLDFSITSTDAANTGTSGSPAIKTGVGFNFTATSAPGYDGTPTVDNTQAVGSPTAGTLSGTFGAAPIGTGIAAGNSFTYSEVGNLGLNANAVVDTGFTSVDQPGDCTNDFSTTLVGGKYGCKIGSTAVAQTTGSSGFGRFIPDHFALSAPGSVTQACSSGGFSYMGQGASLSNVKIEARNSGNTKTSNYAGSYVKLNPATGSFNFAARDTGGGGTNLATGRITATTSGTWTAGELTLSVNPFSIARLASPDGPYDATKIAIAPSDTDSIVLQSGDFNVDTDAIAGNDHAQIGTDTKWRFGRLRLLGATGPTSLPLPLTIRTEYWSGSGFATNTLDGCTALPAANFTLGSYVGPLASGDTSVSPATISFAQGVGKLQLTAPPATRKGSVVITADLAAAAASYLQGAWNGVATYNQNPSARAAFGTFGAQPKQFIYQREAF